MKDLPSRDQNSLRLRITQEPSPRVSVLDVLAVLGHADPKSSWNYLQRQHPDLVAEAFSFGGRGRPTPVVGKQELLKLLLVLDGPKAVAFRECVVSLLQCCPFGAGISSGLHSYS